MTYPPRAGTYTADHEPKNHNQDQDYLRRIAEAVERIADAIAGSAPRIEADSPTSYPVLDEDGNESSRAGATEPHIGHSGTLFFAVCTYCPAIPGRAIDPCNPSTWLEHDESQDLDEQSAALTRHLAHHQEHGDPTAALPIWTWSDRPCPHCYAPVGHTCRTVSGRPSTAVHARRWQDHSSRYW